MNKVLDKYRNLSLPIKAVFWFTICNFILKGISFISVPLFTRLMSTEQYGMMSVYYSYEQIFLVFATLELSVGAYQRGILKFKDNLDLFTESIQLLSNLVTIVLFIFFCLFSTWIINATDIVLNIYVLMFIYFLMQPAYNSWLNRKRFSFEYRPAVLSTILFSILTVGCSIFAVYFIRNTAYIKITTMLIVQILFCFPFYVKNIKLKNILQNKNKVLEYWRFSLKFQLPLVLHILSYLVLGQSDRIMIGKMVSNSKAAIYSVAYSLSSIITMVESSINQSFKPWRYQQLEQKNYTNIKNVSNILIMIMGAIVISFIVVLPEGIKLLFNADYHEAIWVAPPIILGVYFLFLYTIFTDVESYYGKTKYIAYASIICAVLNLILNYLGIKLIGYIACGYATLICYILFALMHYFFMKKVCKESIDEKVEMFNAKFFVGFSLVIVIIVTVLTLFYEIALLRYGLLLIVLIVVFIKRNYLIKLFNSLKVK